MDGTRGLMVAAAVAVLCSTAWAGGKILSDVPNYVTSDPAPGDGRPPMAGAGDLTTATLSPQDGRPVIGTDPLSSVPEYTWWYGCSPTASGMMVAYWDAQAGFEDLYKKGDSQVWSGDGDSGTRRMVASTAHITAGAENGYTCGDWHNSASYPNHEANPDCVADFIKVVDGGTTAADIAAGLESCCEWDDTSTYDMKDGYPATATMREVPFWGGTCSYQGFKAEIDAGRPVLLNVITAGAPGLWAGHSVVGYGYQDNMFAVRVPVLGSDPVSLTVGGFAVRDTWAAGITDSEWRDWSMSLIYPVIDGKGIEWWPFIEFQGSSWTYDTAPPYGPYDWMVSESIGLLVVPEPASFVLFGLAALALFRRRK